jgi:hypothetical protein
MRTLDYIDLFNAVSHRARLPVADDGSSLADGREFVTLRTLLSDRLATIWAAQKWPDLCPVEKRYFRDLWSSATAYAAPSLTAAVEVYYPGPQKYYQTLRAGTNHAPATLSGSTWTTNLDYWAECSSAESARNYSATATYVKGDQVYYSVTDRIYQLYAATSTGNLPTDATKWGLLTPFDRYVAYEQTGQTAFDHAFGAFDQNPRITKAATELDTYLSENGLQVRDNVAFCFLEYRRLIPILTGTVYDATASYALGSQVYYSSASLRGNFYDVTFGPTDPGDTPSNSADFTLVEIPLDFKKYLQHGAAADYLLPAEGEDAAAEMMLAEKELERITLLHLAQLANRQTTTVRTR